MAGGARVCFGQIDAPHGIRGEVRLRSFTSEPEAIANYGPLETEDGRVVEIESLRPVKNHFIAKLSGICDRNAAEQLANVKLYVPRERLPELEADEFYYADLIGLAVVDPTGKNLGIVVAVYNFGAGDLIEVRPREGKRTYLLPFNDATVPVVDLAAGRIVVKAPEETRAASPLAAGGSEAKPSRVKGRPKKRPLKRPLPAHAGPRPSPQKRRG